MRLHMDDVVPGLAGVTPLLIAADLLAVTGASLAVADSVTLVTVLCAAVGGAVVSRGLSLQRSRLVLSVLEDLPALCLTALASTLLLLATSGLDVGDGGAVLGPVAAFAATTLGLLATLRGVAYTLVRAGRRRGVLSHPVVIVGTDGVARRLAAALLADRSLGLHPVGFVDDDVETALDLPVPLLGALGDLPHAMRALDVNDVIFAFGNAPDERALALVRYCQSQDHQVFVVPRFYEMMGLDRPSRIEVVRDVAVVRLRRWRVRPHALLVKRCFDATLSAAALAALAPLMLGIALAVRLETGPGVIFRQVRVGRGGRTFELMKFRSMKPADPSESATAWNIDNDHRIGPVGRFLRRTGLDELPQLVNILRGDMSLVGPRPERPYFVEQFSRETRGYGHRHRVPMGLTGWAQVNDLRGDTSIDDRVRADNYYIENWSLWGDVKIVVRTARTLVRPQPAATPASVGPTTADHGTGDDRAAEVAVDPAVVRRIDGAQRPPTGQRGSEGSPESVRRGA